MTIGEAITEFREMIPSACDDGILIRWLSEAERTVVDEIILTHEGAPEGAEEFDGYSFNESRDSELYAPDPYSKMYVEYLAMKYYVAICDVDRYNVYAALFYTSWSNFADYCNRNRRPKRKTKKFKFGELMN